ncbi:hypothetical protein L9F63_025188 [Diploptera punctata]|uniref:Uncharacterized protein n=1 Tax=Diploptera punctata TaxID=6984 RepID=A0AAD8E5W5_DIPPU|nr:hypothetical protein L9F63_025188 [Diploptera punctata]
MDIDFDNICRLCMQTDDSFVNIFESSNDLPSKIEAISSRIKVNREDGMPSQVCRQCALQLNTCYDFKIQCEKSDSSLKKYLSHNTEVCQSTLPTVLPGKEMEWDMRLTSALSDGAEVSLQERRPEETRVCLGVKKYEEKFKSEYEDSSLDLEVKEEVDDGIDAGKDLEVKEENDDDIDVGKISAEEENKNIINSNHRHAEDDSSVCSICGRKFRQLTTLKVHLLSHNTERRKRRRNLKTQSLTCNKKSMAGKSLRHSVKLKAQTTAEDKQFTCKSCGDCFDSRDQLKSHSQKHSGEKLCECPLCGKRFSHALSLKSHAYTHSGEKPHVCQICGRGFVTRGNLKTHFLTHTGEKPFLCSLCGKEFRHSLSLKAHHLSHTGVKPYVCEICGREFLIRGHLKTHTLTHTGEKPYLCSVCGKGFIKNGDLKRHSSVHTRDKPYICSICGKGFGQKSQLEPHILKHTGQKAHICEVCGKSYTGSQALRRHFLVHTQQQQEQEVSANWLSNDTQVTSNKNLEPASLTDTSHDDGELLVDYEACAQELQNSISAHTGLE